MRNSRVKDCSAWTPIDKPEARAAVMLLEQWEAAGARSRLGRTVGQGWDMVMLSRHWGKRVPPGLSSPLRERLH